MQSADQMSRTTTSDRFVPGARIGDYTVEREVAYEESAIVYFATHVVLPRQTHLKVAHPGSRPAAVQLLREACILEALSHPGVPRVHECGVLPDRRDGARDEPGGDPAGFAGRAGGDRRPWCSIEMMPGITFERLVGDGPVALSDLVVMLRDVADILRHAHERGIVHRRLTASAIIHTQRRRSIHAIEDWGDARTLDAAADEAIDARDDIHALGAIAFHALTGRAPQPGVSAGTHCSSAPTELLAVLDQMLLEPVARPSAAEVYDRALWLCETLEGPRLDRPRWTPPQGFVKEGVSSEDSGGFAVRISRARTS
jgi:serine/threonine protein kinase